MSKQHRPSMKELALAEAWYKQEYPENRSDGIGPMQLRAFIGGLRLGRTEGQTIMAEQVLEELSR